MRTGLLLLAALSTSAVAQDEGRVPDPASTKTVTANLKSCPAPLWPKESLRREETGTVTLAFLIGADGSVLESLVKKSSGFPLLDQAARDGLQKCKFTPLSQGGRTEPQWTQMQYVWTLAPQDAGKAAAERAKILADAEAGNADAQFKAAAIRIQFEPKDPVQALQLLRKAAEQGHARAQEALGAELMYGRHTQVDLDEAEVWLRKAAVQGGASAQFTLSLLLQRQGNDESSLWLTKATAQDYAPALRHTARGLLAANTELERAVGLLQMAVDKHDRGAQYLLGQCYEEGKGVPQDRKKAMELYERASAGGVNEARVAIARLRSVAQ
jgi:TonB family protein